MEIQGVLIIGISGVTCGGKTTLASELKTIYPRSVVLSQDNYCLPLTDPRHIWCEEINHINFDVITGLDMEKMITDLKAEIGDGKLVKPGAHKGEHSMNYTSYSVLVTMIEEELKRRNIKLIILDGFLLFNYKPLLSLINLKYFFTLEKDECFIRRCRKVYNPPDVTGYFEKCVWPEYLKYLEYVTTSVEDITYFDGSAKSSLEMVLRDIFHYLK